MRDDGFVLKVCLEFGCGRVSEQSRCPKHRGPARSGSPNTAARRALRREVLERDGYVCHWCGGPAIELDHLIPRQAGGGNEEANLVAACRSCNASRTPH